MKPVLDTVQGYYSKYRTVKIITHTGFKRTIFVTKRNKIIKDVIKIFPNHPKDCTCGHKKSESIVWNKEEISRTNP